MSERSVENDAGCMTAQTFTHEDVVLLARWLESEGATVREVIDAIERPWKWADEINAARALFGAVLTTGQVE